MPPKKEAQSPAKPAGKTPAAKSPPAAAKPAPAAAKPAPAAAKPAAAASAGQKFSKKAKRTANDSRNPEIARSIGRFGSSAMFRRAGRWAIKNKTSQPKNVPVVKTITKQVKGAKNGGERKITAKAARFYPTEDAPHKLHSNKPKAKPAKLRKEITPGTVLILLAGRFRGRRVVFLKQLTSGLLLVTGPYKCNGVPLRRVNQSYVQATSTHVDVAGISVAKFNDTYFRRPAKKHTKKSEEEFFKQDKEVKTPLSADRKKDQTEVDGALLKKIGKATAPLFMYLGSRFSLTKGQYPHDLKF